MEKPLVIECLPPEILAHVFHFLHRPAPSDERLHDQPHADMLRRPHGNPPLKTVSLVSKRWRATVLPLLFCNVVWYLDRFDLMKVEEQTKNSSVGPGTTGPTALPILPFLCDNNLTSYVKSFTLVVISPSSRSTSPVSSEVGLYRRGDASGYYGYLHAPLSPGGGVGGASATRDLVFNGDTNWLWKLLFDVVDPLRFTIIASPCMLARMLARMLFLGDAWSFDQSHHILSLSREEGSPRQRRMSRDTRSSDVVSVTNNITATTTSQQQEMPFASPRPSSSSSSSNSSLIRPAKRIPCELFTNPPWTALLLNEGSSTRVYKTYEWFHKRPPSMFGALLGVEEFPNDVPLIPPSITDLSYVGIFPLSRHVDTLVHNLPPLRRLFVQLVPRNDILQDRKEMEHLDMDDLWMERDVAYERIVPKFFPDFATDEAATAAAAAVSESFNNHNFGNWRCLEEFETGDLVDTDIWKAGVKMMALGYGGWMAGEREGLFIRKTKSE